MKVFLKALCLGAFALVVGCSTGNCRQQTQKTGSVAINNQPDPMAQGDVAVKPTDRVRVFKYDGSLQCGQGKPISIEEMKKELQDIPVYMAENKSDSLMRIQQCGTPTGKANVFEIDRKNLEQAKKSGFQLWTFE